MKNHKINQSSRKNGEQKLLGELKNYKNLQRIVLEIACE